MGPAFTQHAALPLPASPPPLPGRLDPWAVGLPFPPEKLLLDAGFGALRTKGVRREEKGKRGRSQKQNVPRGLFSRKTECYDLALQPEEDPALGSLGVTFSDPQAFLEGCSGSAVLQARNEKGQENTRGLRDCHLGPCKSEREVALGTRRGPGPEPAPSPSDAERAAERTASAGPTRGAPPPASRGHGGET